MINFEILALLVLSACCIGFYNLSQRKEKLLKAQRIELDYLRDRCGRLDSDCNGLRRQIRAVKRDLWHPETRISADRVERGNDPFGFKSDGYCVCADVFDAQYDYSRSWIAVALAYVPVTGSRTIEQCKDEAEKLAANLKRQLAKL